MATRKSDEANEAAKPKAIRNNYRSPLQISDGVIIPAGGSVVIDDMDALIKNRTVAAWLKAGVIEVI
jgi:hypothetical protein